LQMVYKQMWWPGFGQWYWWNCQCGQIEKTWQKEFPNNSAPYTSTVVFLVRKGNPKQLKIGMIWTKPGVEIITPNPKTGGAPRWIYLSAWGYALKQPGGNDAKAVNWKNFIKMSKC
jgi:sulfate transport system substrate-binding protein